MALLRINSVAFAAAVLAAAQPAAAETLADAIALAYQSNPTLQGQRADLRATDEAFVQAREAWGPTVQLQVTPAYEEQRFESVRGDSNSGAVQVVASQPLYTGGRLSANISAAEAQVMGTRQTLRLGESTVVLEVIEAYADVLRDEQSLAVHRDNIDILSRQLDETEARRKGGELTKTDVAQAQAQMEAERAATAGAVAQLEASRAAYASSVGQAPGELAAAPPLPGLPDSFDGAMTAASAGNPSVLATLFAERRSRALISEARAAASPNVTLNAAYTYAALLAPFGRFPERTVQGSITITQPLFASGQIRSQVRQAVDQNEVDQLAVDAARRALLQNMTNAWQAMLTQAAAARAQQAQVDAAAAAAAFMRIEYNAGQRSTTEVLLADETLVNARLSLLAAEHDAYVGSASVLFYMGRLEARDVVAGLAPYDASDNLRRVTPFGLALLQGVIGAADLLTTPAASPAHAAPLRAGAPRMIAPAGTPGPVQAGAAPSMPSAAQGAGGSQ